MMGDMGDMEQVTIIKKVAANKAREDEMQIYEHMLKNDPQCLRQSVRLRNEYEKAAASLKPPPTGRDEAERKRKEEAHQKRKQEAQQKARRLRVAIKHVIEDGKHLPPKGPPLIPEDTFPIKAHTPHRRRADETVQAIHRHRAYKDSKFVDTAVEEQYLFNESAFNQAWDEEEANRRRAQQGSTATAPMQSGLSESSSAQLCYATGGPSTRQVEEPAATDQAARSQAAERYHQAQLERTIEEDEAQARRLKRAEDTHMLLGKAQSIVDAEREEREAARRAKRSRRNAERARNAASQAGEIRPVPPAAMKRPQQPAAQDQRQDQRQDQLGPELGARDTGGARSEAQQPDTEFYDRMVGRRGSVIQRMAQAAAKNWGQGHHKTQAQEGTASSEPRHDTRRQARVDARRETRDEVGQAEPSQGQRRIPGPPLGALRKLGGAMANNWRQGGYPVEMKKAQKEHREAVKAQRLAEAQARGERPPQGVAKRLGGVMAGALRRGRPPPGGAGRPPGVTGQPSGGAGHPSGGVGQGPSSAGRAVGGIGQHSDLTDQGPAGAAQGSISSDRAPTNPTRRDMPGFTIGVGSEKELHGLPHQQSRSRVSWEGPQSIFSPSRPLRRVSADARVQDEAANQGRDLPELGATAESGEIMSRASSAPSSAPSLKAGIPNLTGRQSGSLPRLTAQEAEGAGRRPHGVPPLPFVRVEAGEGQRSGSSPPRGAAQGGEGTGRRSGGTPPKNTAQYQSSRSRAVAQQGPFEPMFTPPADTSRPGDAPASGTLRSRYSSVEGGSSSSRTSTPASYGQPPSDEEAYNEVYANLKRSPGRKAASSRRPSPPSQNVARNESPRSRPAAQGPTPPSQSAARNESPRPRPAAAQGGPSGERARIDFLQPPSDEAGARSPMRRSPRYENITTQDQSPPSHKKARKISPRPPWDNNLNGRRNPASGEGAQPQQEPNPLLHQTPPTTTAPQDQSPRPQEGSPPPCIALPPESPTVSARKVLFGKRDESPYKLRP